MSDYVPGKDREFLDWANGLYDYAAVHYSPWNVPPPQTAFGALMENYQTAYKAAVSPDHSSVDILRKNEARGALEKEIRAYVKEFLINNSLVTDDDRKEMGVPIHKTTRTPVPVPATYPALKIDTGVPRRLLITYHDSASEKRGKPEGVHGAEVRWAQLDKPPADVGELINSSFDTKPPLILDFKEHERGQRVFLCARWEINRDGEKGPFGNIEEAFIP
ncbi:MAG: hypothetical protein LBL15_01170 [Oscillospiraceae bacterium]|jgi:hypothetical protein|nr:hypothetical protein [Oscillospiraceae bacterium]